MPAQGGLLFVPVSSAHERHIMQPLTSTPHDSGLGQPPASPRRWRLVDIGVATRAGVPLGVVFFLRGFRDSGPEAPFKALLPGGQPFVAWLRLRGAGPVRLCIRTP